MNYQYFVSKIAKDKLKRLVFIFLLVYTDKIRLVKNNEHVNVHMYCCNA